MKYLAVVVAIWSVMIAFYFVAVPEEQPNTPNVKTVNDAEMIAQCIAEESYTHPMGDKWLTLTYAISACDLTMTRVKGEG